MTKLCSILLRVVVQCLCDVPSNWSTIPRLQGEFPRRKKFKNYSFFSFHFHVKLLIKDYRHTRKDMIPFKQDQLLKLWHTRHVLCLSMNRPCPSTISNAGYIREKPFDWGNLDEYIFSLSLSSAEKEEKHRKSGPPLRNLASNYFISQSRPTKLGERTKGATREISIDVFVLPMKVKVATQCESDCSVRAVEELEIEQTIEPTS